MPLDQGFCTFVFSHLDERPSIGIVSESDRRSPSYRTLRAKSATTSAISLNDPYCSKSYGELNSSAPLPNSKIARITLHDPEESIFLVSSSSIGSGFRWKFRFFGHKFRIRKEFPMSLGPGNCVVEWIPKREESDDPPILVAQIVFKASKSSLTMVDHNLRRLQVDDLKGFEVILILAMFFFIDYWTGDARSDASATTPGTTGTTKLTVPESKRLARFRDPIAEIARVNEARERDGEGVVKVKRQRGVISRLLKRREESTFVDGMGGQRTRVVAQ